MLGSGETGVLTFRNGDVTKSVYLHMGRVVYARSSNPDERLGESLLLRGKITARQYLEASQLIAPGRRLGTILVELEALEPEDLIGAIEHHVREILLDVFTWTHGEYELAMNEPGKDDVVALNLPTENLILEGIRRTRSWSPVFRGIGDIDVDPDAHRQHGRALQARAHRRGAGGRWPTSTAAPRSSRSARSPTSRNFETCRILWALQVLGVIRRGQPGEAAARQEDVARARRSWTSRRSSRSSTRC